jgi:hypothetical protein
MQLKFKKAIECESYLFADKQNFLFVSLSLKYVAKLWVCAYHTKTV